MLPDSLGAAAAADPEGRPDGTAPAARHAPDVAMVLCAGFGTRLRPLTMLRPKPLVEVAGRSLLDRIFDRLHPAGIRRVVVNTHYLAGQVHAHLASRARPEVLLSDEAVLLETGGGIQKALPLLGSRPFYAINGDALWLDGPRPALRRLAEFWDGERMDALQLLHPAVLVGSYDGRGDYHMDEFGRLRRRREDEVAPFVYAGVQILHPRLFDGVAPGRFSLNRLWDRAEAAGRLFGLRHDGEWFHISTPADLADADAWIRRGGRSTY